MLTYDCRNKSKETSTYLVFDGIDTFADITLCSQYIGSVDNQFRQWIFDVTSVVSTCTSEPVLVLSFTAAPAMASYLASPANPTANCTICFEIGYEFADREFIRKEQSDFGWDWGPAYAPAGIWKPAYVVQLQEEGEVYVKNSMVDIYRKGQLNNLLPDQTQPWVVNASIDYLGTLPHGATICTTFTDKARSTLFSEELVNVTVTNGTITGSTLVTGNPELWWPVGYGKQNLYDMKLEIIGAKNDVLASVRKRVGFRTIVLNQGLITDEQQAMGIAPGANWHFEINGHEIFCKGSNLVPFDAFWPRVKEADFRVLLESVVAGVSLLSRFN